jgi:hypothetical protein
VQFLILPIWQFAAKVDHAELQGGSEDPLDQARRIGVS